MKMLKIYNTLNTDLKSVHNHNLNEKNYGRARMFLPEETVAVVSVRMWNLKTLLKKCLMKIFVGFIYFSDDF